MKRKENLKRYKVIIEVQNTVIEIEITGIAITESDYSYIVLGENNEWLHIFDRASTAYIQKIAEEKPLKIVKERKPA